MTHQYSTHRLLLFIGLLTLVILSCQGATGANPFATETSTSTLTPTPTSTPTFTPSPTLTPTKTPSPTPLPSGSMTKDQADGSTLFIDYDNHYQLNIPPAWFVIPVNAEDIAETLERLEEANPQFKKQAEAFARMDPDVIRVVALNQDTKYIVNGFATNLTVTAVEDPVMSSMPLDFVTGAVEESLKQQSATLLPSEELASENRNGVEIGIIAFEQATFSATGAKILAHSTILVFQANGKVVLIQVAVPKTLAGEILPVMEQIRNTIKLLES